MACNSSCSTPVACNPHALTEDERARSKALRAELDGEIRETIELSDGYAFRYRSDPILFRKVAEWIALEKQCCPFFSFELGWPEGEDATLTLKLSGAEGTIAFLAAEMPNLPNADASR